MRILRRNKEAYILREETGKTIKVKRSNILGPYIPYGLFQTKEELCAKFGSYWFRNVNLYKVQTHTHKTNIQLYVYMYTLL
jgi:hypothetical protein